MISLSLTDLLVVLGMFAASSALSMAVVLVVVLRLPATYFLDTLTAVPPRHGAPWVRRVAKNALGGVLIAIGAVLALPGVPGQGLLTMLIGVMLLDVRWKRRLELKLLDRPGVLTTINRVRARFGRPPLVVDRGARVP